MRCIAAAVLLAYVSLRSTPSVALPHPVSSKDKCAHACPKDFSSTNLDDGPCFDLRNSSSNHESKYRSAMNQSIELLKQYYAFTDWKRLDLDRLSEPSMQDAALADKTGDVIHMHTAVAKLVAAIPDGHMEYDTLNNDDGICGPEADKLHSQAKFEHMGGGFGVTVSGLDDGSTIITHVVKGSKAAQAGLAIGDVVEAIDGMLALERVKAQGMAGWLWVDQNPSTSQNRLMEQWRQIVRAPVGTERNWSVSNKVVSLVAQADDFHTYDLTHPASLWYNVSAGEEISPAWPIKPDCDDGCATIHTQMLDDGYGYIGLGEEDVKHLDERMAAAVASLKGAKGILLDWRSNDGGDDPQGAEIVDFFLPEGTPYRIYEKAAYSNRLLATAGHGELRKYMNGTDLDDWGIVPVAVDDADGTIYTNVSTLDKLKSKVPGFTGPFTGPVVLLINSDCDSTCEGVAKGIAELPSSRSAVVGFDGTTGCFGMSGGTVVVPGDIEISFPFGRSLDRNNIIQVDSDFTGVGGVLPTVPIVRNSSNAIRFVQQRLDEDGQCCYPGCFKPCASAGIPYHHRRRRKKSLHATSGDLELDFGLQILKQLQA